MAPKKNKNDEQQGMQAARFGRVSNNLKMGIVGLPNVGKSSLFNILCAMDVPSENYPFCTIDPTSSRCQVPDERFTYLSGIWKPQAVVPSYLSITDIAGLVKGAAQGAGLGNAFLSHIASVDGIFHVVRAFPDSKIIHEEGSVNPVRDLGIIMSELCQKDSVYVLKEAEQVVQANKNKKAKLPDNYEYCLNTIKKLLDEDKPVLMGDWSMTDVDHIKEYYPLLFTTKPIITLVNCSITQYVSGNIEGLDDIQAWIDERGGGMVIPFSVKFEKGILQHKENPEKIAEIEKKAGKPSAIPHMIKSGYDILNLINFFTCGPKEVRSWTVYGGSTAPQASAVIHTDFQKYFIKAEVVAYQDFHDIATKPGMEELRAAGKYRQEGKNYVVKSGDILNIMHNAK